MTHDTGSTAGIGVGMIVGAYKGVTASTTLAMITPTLLYEAAIYAFVGGILGGAGNALYKYASKKVKEFRAKRIVS